MRLPRVRLTVRWMMVAVAIVAAILSAFEAGRRWEAARSRATHLVPFRTHGGVGP